MAKPDLNTAGRPGKSGEPRYLRLVTVEGNVVGKKPPKSASPQRMRLSSFVKSLEFAIASASHADELIERIARAECDDPVLLKSAAREAWRCTEGLARMLEALSEDLQTRVEL